MGEEKIQNTGRKSLKMEAENIQDRELEEKIAYLILIFNTVRYQYQKQNNYQA